MIGNFTFKSVFIQALWRIVDNWAGMKRSWLSNWFVSQWIFIRLLDWRLWCGEGLVGLVRLRVDGCDWKEKWDKSFNIVVYTCKWRSCSFCTVGYNLCFALTMMKLYFNGPYFPCKYTLKTWKLTNCFVYLIFIGLYANKRKMLFDDSHYSSKWTVLLSNTSFAIAFMVVHFFMFTVAVNI